MSSILKALKKLEREKSQQRDDHIDLARDIFRGSESRRGSDWLTIIIVGAVALALVAVILFVLRLMERSQIGEAVAPPAMRLASPPVVQQSNDSVVEEIVDQRRPQMRVPAAQRPAAIRRNLPSEVARVPAKGPDPVVVEEILSPPSAIANQAAQPLPQTVTPQLAAAPEGVVLTAIVFQPEREARIAVINDLPVMEGSFVGDYRVEEIRIDRVILSHNGTHFEVRAP